MSHIVFPSPKHAPTGAPMPQGSGIQVGPYEILHPIGEGGMAQVFLGVRRGAGRFEKRVVLKVLHPRHLDNPEYVSMFIQEARMLARLRHPNIVDVYEVDLVDQSPYLAMEYVNGPTLGHLCRRAREMGKHDLGHLMHVMYQVCLGLHYAHTAIVDGRPAGIVHRDVSSHNILVDAATGNAKLIDFGIAKGDDEQSVTSVGVLKGKLPYMAPEVLRGERADARADIFAVGVLLYRLVTDRLPFPDGDAWATRLTGHYVRPSELAAGVSPRMEAIIERALRPSPHERYRTAEDLAADLALEIERLGANPRRMPQWIAEVFPGGEAEWARRPGMFRTTTHSALSHLLTTTTGATPVAPRPRGLLPLLALTSIAGVTMLAALAALVLAALLVGTRPSVPDARRDAIAFLDAADQMIARNRVDAAREMNGRAAALGVDDVEVVVRITQQKGAIERREAVLRATDRIRAGDYVAARAILVETLERHPSDDELRSQLATLDALIRGRTARPASPAPAPTPSDPPPAPAVVDGDGPGARPDATEVPDGPQPRIVAEASPSPSAEGDPAAPITGLEVRTEPPGLIVLDGVLIGLAPIVIPDVAPGKHEIEARLDGYRTERTTVEVGAGQTAPVELALKREPDASVAAVPVPVAPAAPVPAPAAPAPSPRDELPKPSEVTTPYALRAALVPVQDALVAGGVEASLAKAVLGDFVASIAPRLEAGQVLRVNPRAIHDLVLEMARSGAGRRDISSTLRKSYQSGALD